MKLKYDDYGHPYYTTFWSEWKLPIIFAGVIIAFIGLILGVTLLCEPTAFASQECCECHICECTCHSNTETTTK